MKKLAASIFLAGTGVILLAAAHLFAGWAYAAPAGTERNGASMPELAYSIPALVFAAGGTVAIGAAVVVTALALHGRDK
jgi:hypothetical protein